MTIQEDQYVEFVEDINSFIYKVFNYYNGKINRFNKAILRSIDWGYHGKGSLLGYSRVPNMIFINPGVIFDMCSNIYDLYLNIILTIIHELYHTDQVLSYRRLQLNDIQYIDSIELPVEREVAIYVLNNTTEIEREFGIDIYPNKEFIYNSYVNSFYSEYYFPYKRRDFYSHLYVSLEETLEYREVAEVLYYFIQDYKNTGIGTMIININSYKFIVFDNEYKCDLDSFNALLINTIYNRSMIRIDNLSINKENNILIMDYDGVNSADILCTVRKF